MDQEKSIASPLSGIRLGYITGKKSRKMHELVFLANFLCDVCLEFSLLLLKLGPVHTMFFSAQVF